MVGRYFSAILLLCIISCQSKTDDKERIIDNKLINAINHEIELNLLSENQVLNDHLSLIKLDSTRETVVSGHLFKQNVLFFYFSNLHCSECIDREVELVKQHYTKEQVVILAREGNIRNLIVFKRLKKIDFDIYYMKQEDRLAIAAEELNSPIFFRVNKMKMPYNIYEPKYSYPMFSMHYHSAMKRLLVKVPS